MASIMWCMLVFQGKSTYKTIDYFFLTLSFLPSVRIKCRFIWIYVASHTHAHRYTVLICAMWPNYHAANMAHGFSQGWIFIWHCTDTTWSNAFIQKGDWIIPIGLHKIYFCGCSFLWLKVTFIKKQLEAATYIVAWQPQHSKSHH